MSRRARPTASRPLARPAALLIATLLATACGGGDATPDVTAATARSTSPEPVATAPVTTEPAATAPSTTRPETTQPSPTEPPPTEPSGAEPSSTTTVAGTAPVALTAEAIAAELTEVERALSDPTLDPVADAATLAALGRRQQLAYRQLARHDELDAAVLGAVADDVASAVGLNVAARQVVAAHAATQPPSDPPSTLPAWTILPPAPIDELLAAYADAEALTGVPWEYLAAINFVETRMGRIAGESSAGAIGPMQFLPSTWAACCEGDPTDPHDAIVGAAVYLASEGAPDDMGAALYAYNPNDGYVGQVTAYAANLRAHPLAYRGYHGWEVLVGTTVGTVRLPVGYAQTEPVDAAAWVAAHPEDLLPS